ncbi:DUF1127 domain-containing protein [Falsiroseomonas sp. HW251]|uniref:DUF1127 domain-containing protein n=1 Tax=Falsiroseomonas sp. HW251 TaxID=3390998 RepID=UPI003D323279
MNPRDTQEQIGLFPVSNTPGSAGIDAMLAEAYQARDAAIVSGLRRAFSALWQVVTTWPSRRAAYEQLRGLTDRELADIGLTRGDIAKVFDPGFKAPARAANLNLASRAPRAA